MSAGAVSARAADGELDTRGGYHSKLVAMPRDVREPVIGLPTGERGRRCILTGARKQSSSLTIYCKFSTSD